MDSPTLRSRVIKLTHKSRKALRLYSSIARSGSEASELQLQQWREVNSDLLKHLTELLEQRNQRILAAGIVAVRDRFYAEWRSNESELHRRHKEITLVVEHSDFVRASNLSRKLIQLKARVEATQAAHHELQELIEQSRLKNPAIELANITPSPTTPTAKIIPLHANRRRAQ